MGLASRRWSPNRGNLGQWMIYLERGTWVRAGSYQEESWVAWPILHAGRGRLGPPETVFFAEWNMKPEEQPRRLKKRLWSQKIGNCDCESADAIGAFPFLSPCHRAPATASATTQLKRGPVIPEPLDFPSWPMAAPTTFNGGISHGRRKRIFEAFRFIVR